MPRFFPSTGPDAVGGVGFFDLIVPRVLLGPTLTLDLTPDELAALAAAARRTIAEEFDDG